MPSFAKLFTLAALAAVSSATAISPILTRAKAHGHHCAGGKVAHNTTIDVGGKPVTFTSFQCAPPAPGAAVARRDLWDSPPLCILFGTCKPKPTKTGHPQPTQTPPPPPPPTNVCGVQCTTSCNTNAGSLPPIIDDCQTIKDAIIIFQNELTTFVVDPNHLETLTYGTCSYFFSNTGSSQLEYCWSDLSTTASAASSACFPPIQPLNSEGLCASSDYTWAVGAAHS